MNISKVIASELNIRENQVNEVVKLFDEGATIPFIARYRKERTDGLDEDQLRTIEDRLNYLRLLQDRKETVLKSIEEQGKLTDELKEKIITATKLQEVEDLYLPYKPKRKTKGTVAKAKGLEPLALFILENPKFKGSLDEKGGEFINFEKGVSTIEEALQGAKDIIAEIISESADVRQETREFLIESASIASEKNNPSKSEIAPKKKDVYEIYHNFKSEIKKIKPYQLLALNRGEKEKFLKVLLSYDRPEILDIIYNTYFEYDESVFDDILLETVSDSFDRLIYPSIEREVRNILTEKADLHAVNIFSCNLRQLLLQPPISNRMIMGIDPGFVSGSKLAVIDPTGKYIEGTTIYPHPPQNRKSEAEQIISKLVEKHNVEIIAIGNGTASRETELLVAGIINKYNLKCSYLIVSEAGASVYSASDIARQEFPDLEASQRGNISIARRILDPLAELVKIDPKSIGVGLYQHDVDQKLLGKNLDDVVISCVNYVGVDLNTSSASLLTYVSGLNKRIAGSIIRYREREGKFNSREELLKVTGLGEKAYEQCAGFLKISNGENPLDNTSIHPESYEPTKKLLNKCNVELKDVTKSGEIISFYVDKYSKLKIAGEIGVGLPTLDDIVDNLKKPGRDPRDEMPKPILRSDVLKMEDLEPGMKLMGTVRNVVDFGAFVDIGVKQDGLLHISQIANKYIKNPLEILNVGDIIEVTILSIDPDKGRIGLSMVN